MLKYSENGLWLKQEGDLVKLGLSDKGQDDLGQIAFVEILEQDSYQAGDSFLSLEAAKAVTELTLPVAMDQISWHQDLENNPEWLNSTKEEDNWILMGRLLDPSVWADLLDQSGFEPCSSCERGQD